MKKLTHLCLALILFFVSAAALLAADGSWLHRVPAIERHRVDPTIISRKLSPRASFYLPNTAPSVTAAMRTGGTVILICAANALPKRRTVNWRGCCATAALRKACPRGVRCLSRNDGRSLLFYAACRVTRSRSVSQAINSELDKAGRNKSAEKERREESDLPPAAHLSWNAVRSTRRFRAA